MEQIDYADFKKLDMRVGQITHAERVLKTEKLYRLKVDVGEKIIQIITSLVPYYKEDELKGQKIIVLVNLKPAKFSGEISEGMLLCAETHDAKECVLLTTERNIASGTQIT